MSSSIPTYRLADKSDLNVLLQIEKEMTKTPLYHTLNDKELEKYLSSDKVFLIFLDKQIVGYCSYKIESDNLAEISGMAILEKFRHQGIGTSALKFILTELKNVKKIKLVTHPDNNNSLGLYSKFGFIIKERIENYFGNEPRLILYKIN